MADVLWDRAAADLCVQVSGVPPDRLVCDHSSRVARLSLAIAALPEVAGRSMDRTALIAAGLYHDAGWVLQVRAGELHARDMLLRPTSDLQWEMAADWMLRRLDGIVPPGSLQLAGRAIRLCGQRDTPLAEAQVLREADNLDGIGPQAVLMLVRKLMAEGRTLADLVTAWERQEEYHFWEARIKENFRFPSVRSMAERRWRALQRFMHDLGWAIRLENQNAAPSPRPQDAGAAPSAEGP